MPRLIILAALTALACTLGQTGSTTLAQLAGPRLAFLHMSADAPSLDIYIDNSRVVDGLAFRDTSPYIGLTAGSHTIQVSAARRLEPLLNTSATFPAGSSFTWVLSGLLAAADVTVPLLPDLQFMRAVQLSDNAGDTPDARPRLRAVNASPGSPPFDIRIESNPPQIVAAGLQYGSVSAYAPAVPGTYTVSLSANGTIVATIPTVTVQARTAYTLVLGGLFPGVIAANPTGPVQSFQPVILTDQTSLRTASLTKGCNQVILAASAGTPIATILARIDLPAAVVSVWRFDNSAKQLRAGYFADPSAPLDYSVTQVSPEAAFICVSTTTTWNPFG